LYARALAIRLLLIDDHALFREGLGRLLATEPDLLVVASCPDLACAEAAGKANPIDVVLLDFDLGEERAVDAIQICRRWNPDVKILIVTAGVEERSVTTLIRAGVSGIFHKHNDPQSLSQRIRSVHAGEVFMEQVYLKPLLQMAHPEAAPPKASLTVTAREQSVLDSLLEGLPNKLIAERLGVTEAAVKGTLQQLFQKTGVRTRSQLVRVALEQLHQDRS
jgi:two-component system, NarL family, nitrate/nitrite response regulator NarL